MQIILLGLFCSALLGALVAFRLGHQLRQQTGLPIRARLIYSDTGSWNQVEKPLFSRQHLLAGRPDYLVEADGARIPIEVKPTRVARVPYVSDTMQLAAYGLLVEETFGAPPPYGLLKYRDSVFRVELTQELRVQLHVVLGEMRENFSSDDVARSHAEAPRCQACGYRAVCGQELG